MEYCQIPNVEKPVSRLVQGTIMLSSEEEEYSFNLLDEVYDLGINTFDCAHLYGNGDCERVLGRWLSDRNLRKEVVLLTKCCHMNSDRNRVTPFDISSDLNDSLARLQTDFIDIYLLHRDNPRVPVAPIVDTLNNYINAGILGVIGGSNWTHDRIEAANIYALNSGQQPFGVSSPNFSLAEQVVPPWDGCCSISGNGGVLARLWYEENQMPLFTWSSIANGFFSGRITQDNYLTLADQGLIDESTVKSYCTTENFERLKRVSILAMEKELSIPQVALAYVLQQPLNIFALVGARSSEEVKSNLEALQMEMSKEEMAWLNLELNKQP